ncbi:MAG TPA: hypothetical protein VIT65_18750 [Microlunatus sp.]
MDLSPYLETVRHGVTSAAALGDDNTRLTAERLGGAVEASTRLALIRVLSDAAAQISAETAPTSVELRMNGPDPELVVLVPAPSPEPTLLLPDDTPYPEGSDPDAPPSDAEPALGEPGGSEDDEPVARISLRLPASVKAKVDEKADGDGISTNAWLLRAVMVALDDRPMPPAPPRSGPPTESGPFGPYGVFGPNGPFGAGGVFGGRGRHPGDGPGVEPARRGTVQGWVR